MKEINVIAVKNAIQENLCLKPTEWEVKDRHYLKQTENPDVYIIDICIYGNSQQAFEEEVGRLIAIANEITKDKVTYDCLNLILHKSDFDDVNYLSQYCLATEFCVPQRIVREITSDRSLGNFHKINVYLFSHLDGSKIKQCLVEDVKFSTLSRALTDVCADMAYWYVVKLNNILEGEDDELCIDVELSIEEHTSIMSHLDEIRERYDEIDNIDRKRICDVFKDFDGYDGSSLTGKTILNYITELRNLKIWKNRN